MPFADAIVVAAGRSTRMAGSDKLGELIGGRSMLECSVAAVAAATSVDSIIVVTRAENVERLAAESWLDKAADGRARVVAGGEQRSDSVRAGVAKPAPTLFWFMTPRARLPRRSSSTRSLWPPRPRRGSPGGARRRLAQAW